jgi:dipeptidyl aminopeptidase/acylaminoacyl peptidase
VMHAHPELLPDGRGLLFQAVYRDGHRSIGITDLKTGSRSTLVEGVRGRYARNGWLLYTTADAKLWAAPFDMKRRAVTGSSVQLAERLPDTMTGAVDFAVSENGTLIYSEDVAGEQRELTWVSRTGQRSTVDSLWRGEFRSPTLSPDGSHVAVALSQDGHYDIWVRALVGGSPIRLTAEQRQNSMEPAWSPDGNWVSYLAALGGNTGDVYRRRADGSGAAELVVRSPRPVAEQTWSPNGNTLLVRTTTPTKGAGDILAFHPGTQSEPTSLLNSPRNEYTPAVSPDGRWLAYASNTTGRMEIYVVPLAHPQSSRWMVSSSGGTTPRWSHSGKELFFLDARSNFVSAQVSTTPNFAIQGTRTLFSANDFIQTSISRRNYDVGPDDQRFLFIRKSGGARTGYVVVIENWMNEMKAQKK